MMKSPSTVQNIIRGLLLTFTLALGVQAGQAQQDLHIYYDAFHETFRAMRGDKEVEEYSVRKGNQIFLHTENYNNFIYELEVLQRNKPTANKNNMGFTSLMSMLSPAGGMMPTDIFSGLAGGTESANMFENLFPKSSGYMDGADIQVQQLMSAYDASITTIRKLEKQISYVQNNLKEIEESTRRRDQILKYVHDLKYNPNIPPVKIGELITKELKPLLPKDDNASVTTSPRQEELKSLIQYGEQYRTEVKKLAELDVQAQEIPEGTPKLKTLKTLIHNSHRDTKLVSDVLTSQEATLKKEVARDAGKEFEIQTTIRQEYEAIINNTFSHTYRTQANDNDLELQLVFIARDSTNRPISSGRQEIAPINITVYGGLQINASVGVNFGQFANPPQTYFVRDSFLRSENESNFIPFLTTSVHFYFQSRKNLSFGGTFGVGMALSNSENLETPTFFLGPSVIIGKSQSFTVSAGAMGGRIRRLSQGYQVGDRYSSDANVVPTKTKYELGYYVGISFNMGG